MGSRDRKVLVRNENDAVGVCNSNVGKVGGLSGVLSDDWRQLT